MEINKSKYYIDCFALTHATDRTIWWRSLMPNQIRKAKDVDSEMFNDLAMLLANPNDIELATKIETRARACVSS